MAIPAPLTDAGLAAQYPRLRAVARRLLSDSADVEDAVQTALERAWRFRERYDPALDSGPWLAAIVRRAALDLLRSRRSAEPIDDGYPAGDATEARVLERESARALGSAIAALAPAYRDAILMHDVAGFSSREIASQASLPYHTVRTHLFRARKALRGAIASGVAA